MLFCKPGSVRVERAAGSLDHTVRAMNDALSPCAVYQSPLSNTLIVSSPVSGKFL